MESSAQWQLCGREDYGERRVKGSPVHRKHGDCAPALESHHSGLAESRYLSVQIGIFSSVFHK